MHLLDIKSNATYAEPRQNNPCVLCFCEFVYLCICVLCICVLCILWIRGVNCEVVIVKINCTIVCRLMIARAQKPDDIFLLVGSCILSQTFDLKPVEI